MKNVFFKKSTFVFHPCPRHTQSRPNAVVKRAYSKVGNISLERQNSDVVEK